MTNSFFIAIDPGSAFEANERRRKMNKTPSVPFDLEIEVEELESKIAPDGGETVLPSSALRPGRPQHPEGNQSY